jgi:hypothetical protein
MTNDLLIYGENICAFPHILGSPFSYMTLHLIPSEFPYTVYEENFVFFFISIIMCYVLSELRVKRDGMIEVEDIIKLSISFLILFTISYRFSL